MKLTRFEDLKMWKLAHKLFIDVAEIVKTFPKYEKYDLANQMRRSARSIPSDISEGFGRSHFNDKLTFYERCRASLDELRNHFHEALGNKYIDEVCYKRFVKKIKEIGYLLNRMMKGVQRARDLYKNEKRLTGHSRRSLNSIHEVNNVSRQTRLFAIRNAFIFPERSSYFQPFMAYFERETLYSSLLWLTYIPKE